MRDEKNAERVVKVYMTDDERAVLRRLAAEAGRLTTSAFVRQLVKDADRRVAR